MKEVGDEFVSYLRFCLMLKAFVLLTPFFHSVGLREYSQSQRNYEIAKKDNLLWLTNRIENDNIHNSNVFVSEYLAEMYSVKQGRGFVGHVSEKKPIPTI